MNRLHGVIVGVAIAALTLAACQGNGPGPRPRHSPTPVARATPAPPAISLAEAQKALATYVSTNNAANHTLNTSLLSTVEGGGLYQHSVAQIRQLPTRGKAEQAAYRQPWGFTHVRFVRPPGVTWWAAEAAETPSLDAIVRTALLIFDRGSSGRWKMVVGVTADPGQPLPALTDPALSAIPAAGIRDDITDNYTTGGAHVGATLATSPATIRMRTWWIAHLTHNSIGGTKPLTATTPYRTSYALRTADGGQLLVLNTAVASDDYILRPGYRWSPTPVQRAYIGAGKRVEIISTYLDQSLVYVPHTGKAQVLGSEIEMTGAHGQP